MAIGPLAGGWLVQAFSWRAIFLINVPIAIIILIITERCVPESRDDSAKTTDWLGASIATVALGLLTYGFIELQDARAQTLGIAIVIGGLALIALFVYVEHHSSEPMIPLGIFSSRDFAVSNMYTLLLYAALGAAFFFVPFNLINVQHYSPLAAGAALLPMILLMFVSSRWAGGLVTRIGARVPLTVGAFVAGCGFVAFGLTGVGGSYWTTFFPAIVLLGIGASTFVAPLTTTVMNSAPPQHAGSASGINNAVSRVAGLLAIAILGIVIVVSSHHAVQSTDRALPPAVRHVLESNSLFTGRPPDGGIPTHLRPAAEHAAGVAYSVGFRDAMFACALLSWISAIAAFVFLSGTARTSKQTAESFR